MAVRSAPTNKRKNPPTFRHLPRDRAQKVKKSWIEKKKLQVRWRAQKRKEGLGLLYSGRGSLDEPRNEVEIHGTQKRKVSGDDETDSESGASSSHPVAGTHDRDDPAIDGESGSERPPLRRKKARTTVPQVDEPLSSKLSAKSKGKQPARSLSREGDKPKLKQPKDDSDQPSVRELSRRAYAPASLHSFKADPLHRRKDAVTGSHPEEGKSSKVTGTRTVTPPSQARSDHGRGGGRNNRTSSGRQQSQRRGQPNMKLRMEAMLERIKRDYS
ncbi:hypothetical protein ACEPAF_4437 [Sanghuangporus sanghuang]